MNNASNLLLLIVPEALLGPLLMFLFTSGGLAMILGFRRQAIALVVTAVTIPFAMVVVGALMNALFGALPGWLVMPLAIGLQLIIYLLVGWGLIKMVFGQHAVNEAKGHLLADLIRWMLARAFSLPGFFVLGSFCLFLYARAVR